MAARWTRWITMATPRHGGPSGTRCPALVRSWRSPRIGTSTHRRSRPWLNPRRSTTSTASPMNSSPWNIPRPVIPPWPRRWRRWSSQPGSDWTRTAGASTTAPGRSSCTRSRGRYSRRAALDQCREAVRVPPRTRGEARTLRQHGILIVASGNVVHNLRRIDWSRPDGGLDWAHRFDDAAREHMTTSPAAVLGLRDHPDFPNAVPTPDHFLPLSIWPDWPRLRDRPPMCWWRATPTGRCR